MMKNLYALLLLVCLSLPVAAQSQYATTTSGKRVILNQDGTWSYVNSSVTSSSDYTSTSNKSASSRSTSASSSKKYIRGPRGGCYYINRNGNKTYVDRSMCN
ncbi:DUF3157 family protein [Sphingobacterium corticis]|uniref:DUF3157 family protein n=1 Tax=Sphingobacterium corticis TaxID=1812823 RepID=A0ABW5NLD9_9SPHI